MNIEQATLLLLGIGPEVSVLAPVERREQLRKSAQQVVTRANAASNGGIAS